jgi:hypothetical protein
MNHPHWLQSSWLTVGLLYGALFGHITAMIYGTHPLRLDDRPIFCFYLSLGGAFAGLIVGLLTDCYVPRSETNIFPRPPSGKPPASLCNRLLIALPFILLLYIFLAPAFNVAR